MRLVAMRHRSTKWMELRPLVRVGRVSYGTYLYHPFVFLAVQAIGRQVFHQKKNLYHRGVIHLSAT
jgi:peptidoglycan/LPS O-acetylase OafA/YrhL